MTHKAGFVNIIGNPNVGKSTLMNAFLGEKLSITTSKAQTTRHRIMGIKNEEDYQIVFSDLPGILDPHYKLQEKMLGFINQALQDADIFVYMLEIGERKYNEEIVEKIKNTKLPVIVLINKIDKSAQDKIMEEMKYWKGIFPESDVFAISALHHFNTQAVLDRILELLPESPPYFPKDEMSDKTLRFFVSEIIREKILLNFKQEIPYSVEIVVDEFKETAKLIRIKATIFVARDTQKSILIGKEGQSIKKFATQARKDMEQFLSNKVFLELFVKVSKNWRDNDLQLKRFGYEN
jgi:GTP-binding protein Era